MSCDVHLRTSPLNSVGLTSGSELPKKKTKTSSKHTSRDKDVKTESVSSNKPEDATRTSQPAVAPAAPPASGSKESRKRAADFLSDNEDEEAPQTLSSKDPQAIADAQQTSSKGSKKRKAKKAKREAEAEAAKVAGATLLTADGFNGVTEEKKKSKVKADTTKKPAAQSLQAEAQRTTDQELEDEWGSLPAGDKAHSTKGLTSETTIDADNADEDEDEENAAALLAGFDSDTSDVEDLGWDGNLPDVPLNDQGHSKLQKVKSKDPETESGTMYIGRLPHGFYENEMRAYFGQFGEITELRLARNKQTGASKHFAFIEFASSKVCKIAVETMNAYLLYGHILKCNFIPQQDVPAGLWKGSNRKFRKIPHAKIEREMLAAPKSVEQWEKKNAKEQRKRDKKVKKLKELMDYDAPEAKLKDPKDAVEQARLLAQKFSEQAAKQVEGVQDEEKIDPVAAIEAPDQAAATTEGADKDEGKTKKKKKGKNDAVIAKGADDEPTEPAAAIDAPNQAEAVAEEADKDERNSKKKKKMGKKESVVAEGAEDGANEPTAAMEGPIHAEAASEEAGKGEGKSKKKKKSKKEAMIDEPADDGAQEPAPVIEAPKEVAATAEGDVQDEEKLKKKKKGKKEAVTVEAGGDGVQEPVPLVEIPKEAEATAEDEVQDEGKRKKKGKKSKKDKTKVDTTEANEAALPTAKDSIPEAENEPAMTSADKPAETVALSDETHEGGQPSKKSKKRKMGKGKKEKGAFTYGSADRLMTDNNQKEGLVSAPTPDAKVAIPNHTNPPITTGDYNNKRREKYVPPTHRKMQARADFARNYPELHRAQRNAKKAQERAERRTRKEEKAMKGYEKRKQRREQSENDKAKAAAAKRALKAESAV